MRSHWFTVSALALLALTSCQTPLPTGPTITVMPAPGRSLAQFQNDDLVCRNFAQNQTANARQTGLNSPTGTAAATTVGGTAAGALLGAAAGNAGMGAAIGAGAGLLGGSIWGANKSNNEAASLQQAYNMAYAQCMQTKGNRIGR